MREKLIAMLREIERRIPPPSNCHHALTYCQYGSDETAWEDRLALQVNVGGKFYQFFLDQADFEKQFEAVASEIAELLPATIADSKTQLGVGIGQYIGAPECV